MSSGIKLMCAILAVSLVAGCAKENQSSTPAFSIQGGETTDCFSGFSKHLNAFVSGQMTAEGVSAFWDCTASAVTDFERLTTGDQVNGNYAPSSIVRFLRDYFFQQDLNLTGAQLNAIMELKRVVLGGTSRQISRAELDQLRGLMMELKSICLEIRPYAPVLFNQRSVSDAAQIAEVTQTTAQALSQIGAWIASRRQTYTAAQIQALTSAFDSPTLKIIGALVPPLKAILVPAGGEDILATNWPQLAKTLSSAFAVYLSATSAFQNGLNAGLNSNRLPQSVNAFLAILQDAVESSPNQNIPLAKWDQLAETLPKIFPSFGSASAYHKIWMFADCRLFSGVANCSGNFGLAQLHALQSHIADWLDLLQFAKDGHANTDTRKRFWNLVNSTAAMTWDERGRIAFPIPDGHAWRPEDVRRMVWPFVAIDWVKTAYVGAGPQAIDENEATTIAAEVLPVLQGLGWLTDTTTDIGQKIVREGDAFTLSANGDGNLDLSEAVRYLAFVASAYQAARDWLDVAQKTCGSHSVECVREVGLSTDVMSPMPRFLLWIKTQPQAEFARYMQMAEVTALNTPETGTVQTGDLLQVWMVFEYMETFIMRFDKDHSETISLGEAAQAMKLFGPILARRMAPARWFEADRDTLMSLLQLISEL